MTYTQGIGSGVFQLDITEKGLSVKDAYLKLTEPWFNSISSTMGVFDRPFGYEISYSSSQRESTERSTVFQTLFPEEGDLGAKITLQAPKTSPWSILTLDVGFFAGNGIKMEIDSNFRLTAYYELVKNETSTHLNGYDSDRKDNVFTLRLQYKF